MLEMTDWCPEPYQVRFFVDTEPYLRYLNAAIGGFVGAAVTYFISMLARDE
jgi:GTPase